MSYSYFKSDAFSFDLNLVLGGAPYRVSEVGECFATAAKIQDGDLDSWYDEWTARADRVRTIAQRAAANGNIVSARDAYLRASRYYGAAFFYVLGTRDPSRSMQLWRTHRIAFDNAVALWQTPVERVEIPYEGTTLKAYLFLLDRTGARRPLVIQNNGSDGTIVELIPLGAADAIARGYNTLIFDGPGQGEALYVQKLAFRYDWENVITPVVDWAIKRPNVDPNRIALAGISQAGYWVPRAVAFEHRIAAAVVDPGVMQVWTTWWHNFMDNLPPELQEMFDKGDKEAFDQAIAKGLEQAPPELRFQYAKRAEPFRIESAFELLTQVKKYDLTDVVDKITCPMLITNPENEQFWPGQSKQLYDALKSPKVLVPFTAAEGADGHCEPLGVQVRNQRIYDWLAGIFDKVAA
jgi:hypothetical protein